MTKRSVFAIDAGVLIALGGCLKPRAEAEVNLAAVLDRGELGMAMGRRLLRHLDPQGERHVLIAQVMRIPGGRGSGALLRGSQRKPQGGGAQA